MLVTLNNTKHNIVDTSCSIYNKINDKDNKFLPLDLISDVMTTQGAPNQYASATDKQAKGPSTLKEALKIAAKDVYGCSDINKLRINVR